MSPDATESARRDSPGRPMELMDAVFEHGSFRPESPEGTLVRIAVERVRSAPQPQVLSIEERRRIRRRVVERMMRNPLPSGAPRFSRSDMYHRD